MLVDNFGILRWYQGVDTTLSPTAREVRDEKVLTLIQDNWWRFVTPMGQHTKTRKDKKNRMFVYHLLDIVVDAEWGKMLLSAALALF